MITRFWTFISSTRASRTIFSVLIVSVLAVAGSASTVTVKAGESIQSAVNKNPAGTTFLISAGTYRQQSVVPKTGDSFIGEDGATLNGSTLVTGFKTANHLWTAHIEVSAPSNPPGQCFSSNPMCAYPEDLYFDGVLYTRVASLADVAPGKWFLNYSTGTVYLANNPTGHTIEVTTTRAAFSSAASDVTIKGLTIEKYGNFAQSGAIIAGAYWVIENNVISYNHGAGIKGSSGMKILSNNIHHNGQIGISTGGDNVLVNGNEIAYNNTDRYNFGWEAGGAKFSFTHNLVVSNNNVHDNYGAGLHTDIDNYNALYEYNQTARNLVAGIYHEISFSAVIRYNTIVDDGYTPFGTGIAWGAGIFDNSSPDVEVYGNTVTGCMNGIAAVQYQIRAGGEAYLVQNFYSHGNTVTQSKGVAAGVGDLIGNGAVYTSSANNRFQSDTYNLPGASSLSFHWMNKAIDKPIWNSYGQD